MPVACARLSRAFSSSGFPFCFHIPTMNVPADSPTTVPPQHLVLARGCPAIDAAAILPNINDGFRGRAPDLGAYERGEPLPTYGPRPHGG